MFGIGLFAIAFAIMYMVFHYSIGLAIYILLPYLLYYNIAITILIAIFVLVTLLLVFFAGGKEHKALAVLVTPLLFVVIAVKQLLFIGGVYVIMEASSPTIPIEEWSKTPIVIGIALIILGLLIRLNSSVKTS